MVSKRAESLSCTVCLRVLCYHSHTQRHPRDEERSRPLRTFTGRSLVAGLALKVAALASAAFAVLPAAALAGLDTSGDVALIVGAGGVAAHLLRLIRQRLLWRVRQQLILSYVFIGVVPALLLVAFFVLAGVLTFANIASYLIQTRVRTLVDDVRVLAEQAARRTGNAADEAAARIVLAQVVSERAALYPGLSVDLVPLPGRCVTASGVGPAVAVVVGDWLHLRPPASLPAWVPCDGFASLVLDSREHARPEVAHSALRAVVPVSGDSIRRMLVLDVPLGDALLRRIGEDTGTQLGDLAALPSPAGGAEGRAASAADPRATTVTTRLTDMLRWVAFLDYADWSSGQRGTVGLTIGLSISRLYGRISATPLASLGNFSFGQLLLAGLLVVAALFLIIQSIAFVIGVVLARSITGSVHALFEGTERVRAGDFGHKIAVRRPDQLGELAESFNTMTASIDTLLHEREEKQRLEQELAVARRIQMSLLPQGPLRLPGIVISPHCEPAREVGGDYYDFLPLGPARAGLLIADVAGKGTFAALYMAELKGVIHSLSQMVESPRALLIEANRILSPHLDDRSFITMTYAVIDAEARTFTYARAGHCPLVHVRGVASTGDDRRSAVLAPNGMVLGLKVDTGEMFARVLEEATIPLAPGDVLVLFTDGISEAMNAAGDSFGEQRLLQIVEDRSHDAADDLRQHILEDIRRFSGAAPQHDDMTMLVLKVGEASPSA